MGRKPRLLIVEDEEPILNGLIDLFVFHGYTVESSADGVEGLRKALSAKYDIIILDVMLPGRDGFTICEEIRERDREQPIIILTAKSSDDDVITGLRLGADDYVAKPFSVQELLLRVEAVLRRADFVDGREKTLLVAGNLEIDTRTLTGKRIDPKTGGPLQSEEILFSRREVEVLRYLQHFSERPVSREELLREVWGYERASTIETRTVDIHIAKIRRKIEADPAAPIHLITVRGEGYRLLEAES